MTIHELARVHNGKLRSRNRREALAGAMVTLVLLGAIGAWIAGWIELPYELRRTFIGVTIWGACAVGLLYAIPGVDEAIEDEAEVVEALRASFHRQAVLLGSAPLWYALPPTLLCITSTDITVLRVGFALFGLFVSAINVRAAYRNWTTSRTPLS